MSRKFRGNGVTIHYGAVRNDLSISTESGIKTLDIPNSESKRGRRRRREFAHEFTIDWSKGRYNLPLLFA